MSGASLLARAGKGGTGDWQLRSAHDRQVWLNAPFLIRHRSPNFTSRPFHIPDKAPLRPHSPLYTLVNDLFLAALVRVQSVQSVSHGAAPELHRIRGVAHQVHWLPVRHALLFYYSATLSWRLPLSIIPVQFLNFNSLSKKHTLPTWDELNARSLRRNWLANW